jgi:RimJ/RimL family protein N-acetyltransferase
MVQRKNAFDQPIGAAVTNWTGAILPPRTAIDGQFCRIELLDVDRHLQELFEAYSADPEGRLWTYMPVGPFQSIDDLRNWMTPACQGDDPLFHALLDKAYGRAVGMAAYLRIQASVGVIEVGHIAFSPCLQKTPAATESMYLMMQRAFDELGYRRYEWKCDSLNAASCRAAERLGFSYEGLFRQAIVYKGRNRDTAWYSILDRDWPPIQRAFKKWLDAGNFDAHGRQQQKLQYFITDERQRSK